jgi:hypothetical protein
MDAHAETDKLLKSHGAVLKRDHVHEVWHVAGYGVFVRAKTPSDRNEAWADLTTLRRLLGLQTGKGQEGERRPKRVKNESGPVKEKFQPIFNPIADKLRQAGLIEISLEAQLQGQTARAGHLQEMVDDLTFAVELAGDEIERLRDEVRSLNVRRCESFGCRVERFLNRLWLRLCLRGEKAIAR